MTEEPISKLEKRTLAYLGTGKEASEAQLGLVRQAIEDVKRLSRPMFATAFYSIKDCPIRLEFSSLQKLFELGESDSVCIIISTIGPAIDARMEVLNQRGDYSKSLLIDAAANAYVEQITDDYQGSLNLKNPTFRFAPGYGDVPLELQREIFDNVPGSDKTGVKLDDNYLMHPWKSMTGIIGFKGE